MKGTVFVTEIHCACFEMSVVNSRTKSRPRVKLKDQETDSGSVSHPYIAIRVGLSHGKY